MTRLVTTELLVSKAACIAQVELFASLCPHGIVPTVDWCKQHANKFDWNWAARHLLSPAAQKAYEEAKATALKAYEEAKATAWKAYEEATATAWKAYEEATATALKAYEEATATALKAYVEATATAWKAYEEATATAFARGWAADSE